MFEESNQILEDARKHRYDCIKAECHDRGWRWGLVVGLGIGIFAVIVNSIIRSLS